MSIFVEDIEGNVCGNDDSISSKKAAQLMQLIRSQEAETKLYKQRIIDEYQKWEGIKDSNELLDQVHLSQISFIVSLSVIVICCERQMRKSRK